MELITTKVCMKGNIGVHGNLFGGTMLAWLDEAGAAYACQVAKSTMMVTKCINKVEFCRPVKVGRIVKIYGQTIKVGTTSVRIKLEARSHNPQTQKQKIVCSTEMVFVRIDDEGDAVPIIEEAKLD